MEYEHLVQYYETDRMGVVHHSNYIRWFEEARTYFFEKAGMGYATVEKRGILSPVVAVSAEYKTPCRYCDTMIVDLKMVKYTGVRFVFEYEIRNKATGDICCTGTSKHCFVDEDGKIISVKKVASDVHDMMQSLLSD